MVKTVKKKKVKYFVDSKNSDELTEDMEEITLFDPFSKQKIQIPTRGINCTHHQ